MSRHVHVIGAGLAGLSTALQLALSGEKVTVYEAAPFAGGRCRSFLDRELGCRIDNGNHLVLSGNVAVQDYLYLTNALACFPVHRHRQRRPLDCQDEQRPHSVVDLR
jgi:phytoene dehydrogenase-like protein